MSILVASNGRSSDDFVLNWKKVLGWKKDPFEPEKDNVQYLGGYEKEKEKLNLFILNERKFGTIRGEEGLGKTMLLGWLKNSLEKHKTRFYPILVTAEDLKHEKKLIKVLSEPFRQEHPFKAKFGKLRINKVNKRNVHQYLAENVRRHYVLMVEDSHDLNKTDIDMLKNIAAIEHASIILVGRKGMHKLPLAHIGKDQLNIELKQLDFQGAKAMLQKRIESAGGIGTWPFDDKQLKDLFSIVDYNPTRILQFCREKAKELAIEVKQNKIPPPEKQKEKKEEHVYKWNPDILQEKVKEKLAKAGFGIKFTIRPDHAEHPAQQAKSPEVKQEQQEETQKAPEKEEKNEPEKEEKKEEEHAIVIDFGMGEDKKPTPKKEKHVSIHLDGRTFHKSSSSAAHEDHKAHAVHVAHKKIKNTPYKKK